MLECVEVEGVSYLKQETEIVCWEGQHQVEVLVVVIPMLIIWALVYPLFIFIILRRNKSRLSDPDMLVKFGIYYVGLTDKRYYWEVLFLNTRKIMVSAVFALLNSVSVFWTVMASFSVIYIIFGFFKKLDPFYSLMATNLEKIATIVSMITLLAALAFTRVEYYNHI